MVLNFKINSDIPSRLINLLFFFFVIQFSVSVSVMNIKLNVLSRVAMFSCEK